MAMASIKDLINDLRKLSDYMITVPENEKEVHHCLGTYLLARGYNVVYIDKPVDFVVKIGDAEVPIEVKLNPSSERINDLIDDLYKDMKEKGWREGILLVVDTKKQGKAYYEAERIGEKEKWGRKIYVIAVRKTG
jgi:hypothetical protein